MEQQKKYRIITNKNRRRILEITDVVEVDLEPDLSFEDFDAVFINVMSPVMHRNMLAINLASPVQTEKCRFKPCYVTQRLKGWLGRAEVIVDGYALEPTDNNMANGIEDIYTNMRQLNFLLGTPPVVTHAEEILRLCRYAVSRRWFTFSSEPTPGLSAGYMALYFYTLWHHDQEQMQMEERNFLHSQMLKLGYIRRTRFINKIHVCPSCHRSYLLFLECCPKCGSSNLKEEPVIHHFRCANVSPESAYQWDGELRCPKCKQMLRHIGVDYDKPSSVFTCKECGNSFMYPKMSVLCTTCKKISTTDELNSIDVEEYEFTPEGIKACANNDISLTISQVGFYGYSSMRDFLEYIRLFPQMIQEGESFVVARFYVFDPTMDEMVALDAVPPIVRATRRFFNYKSALWGNNYYFLCRVKDGEIAARQNYMEYELKEEFEDYQKSHPGFQYDLVETYIFNPSDDVERFISRIEEDRK